MNEAEKLAEDHQQPSVDVAAAMAWLDAQWQGQRACPVSGHTTWLLNTDVAVVLVATAQGIEFGRGFPMIMLTCEGCGHVLFFDALKLGVVHIPGASAEVVDAD